MINRRSAGTIIELAYYLSLDYLIYKFYKYWRNNKDKYKNREYFTNKEISEYVGTINGEGYFGFEEDDLRVLVFLKGMSPITKVPIVYKSKKGNLYKINQWKFNPDYFDICYRGPPIFYKPIPYKFKKNIKNSEYYKTCFKDPPLYSNSKESPGIPNILEKLVLGDLFTEKKGDS